MSVNIAKEYFLKEADEHLHILQEVMENLDTLLTHPEERNRAHQALFCLRGILGMLNYSSSIAAYGLDDCLQSISQHPKIVDQKNITAFTQLVDLLRQTVQAAIDEMPIDSSDWANLQFRSSVAIDALKSDL